MSGLTPEQFGEKMLVYLPKLSREISCYESKYLKEGILTLSQVRVLEILSHQSQCSMKELAMDMGITLSSATGMMDRMVKQGMVKRIPGKEDRRMVFIQITAKGDKIIKDIYQQKSKSFIKLFSRLTAQERYQYIALVEKLVDSLSSAEN